MKVRLPMVNNRMLFGVALLTGFVASVLVTGTAQGAYVWDLLKYDGTVNVLNMRGWGAVYKWTGSSWQEEGDIALNALTTDHLLVMVMRAFKVNGLDVSGYSGEITAYLALRIAQVVPGKYVLGPHGESNDPFNKLTSHQVLALYFDTNQDFAQGGDRDDSVTRATSGNLKAIWGYRVPTDPEVYVDGNRGALGDTTYINFLGGLEWLVNNFGYSFLPVDNPALLGTETVSVNFYEVQLVNPEGTPSPPGPNWIFRLQDEFTFRLVPEPGTVTALLAMGGAAGLGLALRRRKES
jgi:hypothetical protein